MYEAIKVFQSVYNHVNIPARWVVPNEPYLSPAYDASSEVKGPQSSTNFLSVKEPMENPWPPEMRNYRLGKRLSEFRSSIRRKISDTSVGESITAQEEEKRKYTYEKIMLLEELGVDCKSQRRPRGFLKVIIQYYLLSNGSTKDFS
jgi:hypothetical protein